MIDIFGYSESGKLDDHEEMIFHVLYDMGLYGSNDYVTRFFEKNPRISSAKDCIPVQVTKV